MKTINFYITLSFLLLTFTSASAQCDSIAGRCQKYIADNYISDGQTYMALLSGDDATEFQATLFKGNTYRIAACSGSAESALVFRLIDQDKNVLFSNSDYGTSEYWDFFVENTMSVTIEAQLDKTKLDSGCAVIVIGFRK